MRGLHGTKSEGYSSAFSGSPSACRSPVGTSGFSTGGQGPSGASANVPRAISVMSRRGWRSGLSSQASVSGPSTWGITPGLRRYALSSCCGHVHFVAPFALKSLQLILIGPLLVQPRQDLEAMTMSPFVSTLAPALESR